VLDQIIILVVLFAVFAVGAVAWRLKKKGPPGEGRAPKSKDLTSGSGLKIAHRG
jgi:hypothetical protein